MHIKFWPMAAVLFVSLAGCMQNDLQRAAVGAAAGGLIAGATDNSVATGAIIGGAAGALCGTAGVSACQ